MGVTAKRTFDCRDCFIPAKEGYYAECTASIMIQVDYHVNLNCFNLSIPAVGWIVGYRGLGRRSWLSGIGGGDEGVGDGGQGPGDQRGQ